MADYSRELRRIKETLSGMVKAINSVINVDVTIIDSEFNRLAATGEYLGDVGCKVDANSVFSYALQKGQAFIIENPREHEACLYCRDKGECREYAQVCCPIRVNSHVVGVIGLIAFNEGMRESILSNRENLLEFLRRMSELIAVKVVEETQKERLEMQSRELEVLLDSMDNAVFSVDTNGQIRHANAKARELLNVSEGSKLCEAVLGFTEDKLDGLFEARHKTQGQIQIRTENRGLRLLYSSQPVICDNRVCEVVLTCTNIQTLLHTFHDVVGYGSVIGFGDIIGNNKAFLKTIDFAKRAAKSVSTVLIQGESGTGKELFARSMHYESQRSSEPFITVNCAAIPDNLLESELFGYEEGAFTGALKGGKIGKFEMANKGTVFLDEIGDMPLHLQAKLLRVLQENVVERLGGRSPVPIDVRIVAATNKPLERMVREGSFREDLFYRLNVIPMRIPALRERRDDLVYLMDIFIRKSAEKLGKTIVRADENVVRALVDYDWPGNVRELQNTLEFAVNMCETGVIGLDDLPQRFRDTEKSVHAPLEFQSIKALEKNAIKEALDHFGRDKEGIELSMKALGLSRATLYRKIKTYQL